MSYRRALLTRWSRRDRLTVLVVAVTTAFLVGTIELDEGARPGRGGSAPGTFRLWYLGEG